MWRHGHLGRYALWRGKRLPIPVRITAEAGVVIAKTGMEGQLQVTFTWSGRADSPPPRSGEPGGA